MFWDYVKVCESLSVHLVLCLPEEYVVLRRFCMRCRCSHTVMLHVCMDADVLSFAVRLSAFVGGACKVIRWCLLLWASNVADLDSYRGIIWNFRGTRFVLVISRYVGRFCVHAQTTGGCGGLGFHIVMFVVHFW